MALPAVPHRLTKIRAQNRIRLISAAFIFSFCAVIANMFSISTNEWLHTSEVLKYFVFPNRTAEEEQNPPIYYKNATFGPWRFCWSDPLTEFHCTKVDVFALDDPSDVTTAVELSIRRCVIFMVAGLVVDIFGLFSMCFCFFRRHPYCSLLSSTVINILAGIFPLLKLLNSLQFLCLTNFACIIVYITSVSKEVGNKIYKASKIDESLFHYSYGFSFLLLKISFLCTEMAALLCVIVYMAKRDERTYNAYRMRSMLRNIRTDCEKTTNGRNSPFERHLLDNERYHRHTRMNTLRRKISNSNSSAQEMMISPIPIKITSNNSLSLLALPPRILSRRASAESVESTTAASLRQKFSLSNSNPNPFLLSPFSLANNYCV